MIETRLQLDTYDDEPSDDIVALLIVAELLTVKSIVTLST